MAEQILMFPSLHQVCFMNDERGRWEKSGNELDESAFLQMPAELFCVSLSDLLASFKRPGKSGENILLSMPVIISDAIGHQRCHSSSA